MPGSLCVQRNLLSQVGLKLDTFALTYKNGKQTYKNGTTMAKLLKLRRWLNLRRQEMKREDQGWEPRSLNSRVAATLSRPTSHQRMVKMPDSVSMRKETTSVKCKCMGRATQKQGSKEPWLATVARATVFPKAEVLHQHRISTVGRSTTSPPPSPV